MSQQGIKIAAKAFEHLQNARLELIKLGSKDHAAKSGHQDILLGQMLEKMKDAGKDEFIKLTAMKIEPPKIQ